jgi:hypothetical protein
MIARSWRFGFMRVVIVLRLTAVFFVENSGVPEERKAPLLRAGRTFLHRVMAERLA